MSEWVAIDKFPDINRHQSVNMPLTMRKTMVVWVCLACAGQAWQIQTSSSSAPSIPSVGRSYPLKALASMLLHRSDSFPPSPGTLGLHLCRGKTSLSGVHPVRCGVVQLADEGAEVQEKPDVSSELQGSADEGPKVQKKTEFNSQLQGLGSEILSKKPFGEKREEPTAVNRTQVNFDDIPGISEEDKEIIRLATLVFNIIDQDGSGTIELHELDSHMTKAGFSNKVVPAIFQQLDVNGDGQISLREMVRGFKVLAPLRNAPGLGYFNQQFKEEIYEDAAEVFRLIDTDNSGEISETELKTYLSTHLSYDMDNIDLLFDSIDRDQSGGITLEEFKEAFLKSSALRIAIGQGPNFK